MSDADATDPVKALREFTALPPKWPDILDDRLASIMRDLSAFARTCTAVDDGFARELDAFGKARALLSAAPALLARIEAGEAKLAALESRLAEVAPVVEAAERQERANEASANCTPDTFDEDFESLHTAWVHACCDTDTAVRAMLAARSLRGAGEGGGA